MRSAEEGTSEDRDKHIATHGPNQNRAGPMHDAGQQACARELCSFLWIPRISHWSRDRMPTLLEGRDTRVEKFAKRGYRNAIAALFPNRV